MLINRNDSIEEVVKNTLLEVTRGVVDRKHPFRFVSLATTSEGIINNRLVVLRKLTDDFRMIFFTDDRSNKVDDIENNPRVTLLFWHPGKKAQITFKGNAQLHNQDHFTNQFWSSISVEGRKAYGSVKSPGEPVNHMSDAHNWHPDISDDHFTVIEFVPKGMEVLQLHKLSHYRARFTLKHEIWSGGWIVP
ncbi:MAG: pyridoxamine 5'-phosphate oxidase family protein [Bacteroidota bacterium]